MALTVCLINPPPFYDEDAPTFPIGIGSIAAVLRSKGHHVVIADMALSRWTTPVVLDWLKAVGPDLVGLANIYTSTATSTNNIGRIIRSHFSDVKIAIGGVHASYTYKEILQSGWADFVVRFEAELTMVDLCEAIDNDGDLAKVKGLSWRNGSEIIDNQSREAIHDLDSLPFPAYDLFDMDSYVRPPGRSLSYYSDEPFAIIMSRGCPYSCIYCSSGSFWGPRVRWRTAANIVQEMDFLNQKYGVDFFDFQDDTWTLNYNRIGPVLELLKKRKYRWACETRADRTSEDLLHEMKNTGCMFIRFGFESANQKTLDLLERKIEFSKMTTFIDAARRVGIAVRPSMMIGIPGESTEEIRNTIKVLETANIPGPVAAWAFTPMPGTKVYEAKENYDYVIHSKDFADYTPHSSIISTSGLAREEINLLVLGAQYRLGLLKNRENGQEEDLPKRRPVDSLLPNASYSRNRRALFGLRSNDFPTIAPSLDQLDPGDRLLAALDGYFFELSLEPSVVWLLLEGAMNLDQLRQRAMSVAGTNRRFADIPNCLDSILTELLALKLVVSSACDDEGVVEKVNHAADACEAHVLSRAGIEYLGNMY